MKKNKQCSPMQVELHSHEKTYLLKINSKT